MPLGEGCVNHARLEDKRIDCLSEFVFGEVLLNLKQKGRTSQHSVGVGVGVGVGDGDFDGGDFGGAVGHVGIVSGRGAKVKGEGEIFFSTPPPVRGSGQGDSVLRLKDFLQSGENLLAVALQTVLALGEGVAGDVPREAHLAVGLDFELQTAVDHQFAVGADLLGRVKGDVVADGGGGAVHARIVSGRGAFVKGEKEIFFASHNVRGLDYYPSEARIRASDNEIRRGLRPRLIVALSNPPTPDCLAGFASARSPVSSESRESCPLRLGIP